MCMNLAWLLMEFNVNSIHELCRLQILFNLWELNPHPQAKFSYLHKKQVRSWFDIMAEDRALQQTERKWKMPLLVFFRDARYSPSFFHIFSTFSCHTQNSNFNINELKLRSLSLSFCEQANVGYFADLFLRWMNLVLRY